MSKKKISYSAWDKYLTCPKMYDLHYNHRLRPSGTSSALMFGVAMDEALNVMLLKASLKLAIDTFREKFDWKDMGGVHWDDRDMDHSLVEKEGFKSDGHYAWACMRVKGRMLLEAYHKEIYPLIEEVESVQKNLQDRPGVIDAIVKLRGHGRVLLDNKTSARPYQPDAIGASTQLALYARDQGITRVGFAVLVKQIQKNTVRNCTVCSFDGSLVRHKTCPNIINGLRCHGEWSESYSPKAIVQLMVEDIPDTLGELAHASICQVEKGIEHKVYPRNLRACGKVYGKPCQYIDYCWKGDKSMLEYKPEEKEKKMEKSESVAAAPVNKRAGIDNAMFQIKSELAAVSKSSNNPFFKSKYADLNTHLKAVEPLLAKYGCSLRQPTQFVQGQNVVISAIIHTDTGAEVSSSLGLGEQKDMQKLGAAITYARRYTLSALLSMQAEDDDAESTMSRKPRKVTSSKGDF